MGLLDEIRSDYHRQLCGQVFFIDESGCPNNADRHNTSSLALSKSILSQLGHTLLDAPIKSQTAGQHFEQITCAYIKSAFTHLQHLRPGDWAFEVNQQIENFEQYEHLADLSKILHEHRELQATLGDYLILPDIVVSRFPVIDSVINQTELLLEPDSAARLTPIRKANSGKPILHASISCKWTIRSDRSQNSRTEGLNLIRNRKGNTPHIVLVTAEPTPQRLASVALGTGDIDCVYHIALPELQSAVEQFGNPAIKEMLDILVYGKRLRDISDLPLDLAA
ncbi:MAG TPA: NgoMIV family type II restriction endonuclease [Anaerolineaceae bacterium]|nr:NgoMIV family type II restriction endonuclease [Anaerolineaceae bacterium]HQH84740.1 NgoMIV family type II restriction endonuclease [Anaerolineaceae bacterium]